MAGLIAAVANNHVGIVGIAPLAQLEVFEACWQLQPDSDDAVCNTFTLAKALAAAVDSGIPLINMSIAGPADPLLSLLVNVAIKRGAIFVGAAAEPADAFPTGITGVIAAQGPAALPQFGGIRRTGEPHSDSSAGRAVRLRIWNLSSCRGVDGRHCPATVLSGWSSLNGFDCLPAQGDLGDDGTRGFDQCGRRVRAARPAASGTGRRAPGALTQDQKAHGVRGYSANPACPAQSAAKMPDRARKPDLTPPQSFTSFRDFREVFGL